MSKAINIVIDTNVIIASVEGRADKKAPALTGPAFEFGTLQMGFLWGVLHGFVPTGQIFAGVHIWANVYEKLVIKYGWSAEEACRWINTCKALVAVTGGNYNVVPNDVSSREVTEAEVKWNIDWEDRRIMQLAIDSGARGIITEDVALSSVRHQGVAGIRVRQYCALVSTTDVHSSLDLDAFTTELDRLNAVSLGEQVSALCADLPKKSRKALQSRQPVLVSA
jgi:predicted nucleic acid-binding protein